MTISKGFLLVFATLLLGGSNLFAQNDLGSLFDSAQLNPKNQPVLETFGTTFIVNAQSNETLHQRNLNFYIGHRFGDLAGAYGGAKTLFGLDNATDIKIAFQYGITDRLTVGVGRYKGAPEERYTQVPFNSTQELWYGELKYRLLQQTEDNKKPLAITLYGNGQISTRSAISNPSSDAHFEKFSDRWNFMVQAIIARRFNANFSFEILPTYLHRNLVAYGDNNDMFALGLGGRYKITHNMAIIADGFIPFRSQSSTDYFHSKDIHFYLPVSVGLEIVTGGHTFHINFTNATAISGNQMIPYTTRNWGDGEFRWGFNFSRTFSL